MKFARKCLAEVLFAHFPDVICTWRSGEHPSRVVWRVGVLEPPGLNRNPGSPPACPGGWVPHFSVFPQAPVLLGQKYSLLESMHGRVWMVGRRSPPSRTGVDPPPPGGCPITPGGQQPPPCGGHGAALHKTDPGGPHVPPRQRHRAPRPGRPSRGGGPVMVTNEVLV